MSAISKHKILCRAHKSAILKVDHRVNILVSVHPSAILSGTTGDSLEKLVVDCESLRVNARIWVSRITSCSYRYLGALQACLCSLKNVCLHVSASAQISELEHERHSNH